MHGPPSWTAAGILCWRRLWKTYRLKTIESNAVIVTLFCHLNQIIASILAEIHKCHCNKKDLFLF